MDKYAGQIKDLESKIHELKAKRDGELHALLTRSAKESRWPKRRPARRRCELRNTSEGAAATEAH